jgi:hypothetical protein
MMLSKRLIKKTGWLPIVALMYVFMGLPLIHPFFSNRHFEQHSLNAGPHDPNRGFAQDGQPEKVVQHHPECPICLFSQHFHINHQTNPSVHDYTRYYPEINLSPDIFVTNPLEHTALLPRPPPTSV